MRSQYDVIIVGGGAAGLMAAGITAKNGARTLILEKMSRPGRKLRITGKGRCNITNIAEQNDFIDHFRKTGNSLRQAFAQYFSQDTMDFFESLGVKLTTERGGRVFPASGKAQDVVDAMVNWVTRQGCKIRANTTVEKLIISPLPTPQSPHPSLSLKPGCPHPSLSLEPGCPHPSLSLEPGCPHPDPSNIGIASSQKCSVGIASRQTSASEAISHLKNRITGVQISNQTITAKSIIIATGGASYPATGSTGDGYKFAKQAGHTIIPTRPALVPLETEELFVKKLSGLGLRNIRMSVFTDGKQTDEHFGELSFEPYGIAGPVIITASGAIVDSLCANRKVTISIDLKPALNPEKLDARLQRDFQKRGHEPMSSILRGLLPKQLIRPCLRGSKIQGHRTGSSIRSQERQALIKWLKDFRLTISGHRPIEEAIITAGGVDTCEINPKTMESKIIKGLYIIGELLDIQADTGGYNLQAAFSTGWVAGNSASQTII